MLEDNKLFNFMSRLQNWAQAKLRRQIVQDLSSAIITVDRLLDYKDYGDQRVPKSKQPMTDEKNRGKFEKHTMDGQAYEYEKCKSNRQTVF